MKSTHALRILIGILFIAAGAALLLRITGIIEPLVLPAYLLSWQMILIILGVFFLVSEGNRSTGLVLLIIGAVFLSKSYFGIGFREIFRFAIPVLFVIAGFLLIFPRYMRKKKRYHNRTVTDAGDDLQAVHIFSGGTRVVQSEQFRGGEVVCIFGGADIHFRDTKLAPGPNVLHVSSLFGGCEIFVPNDWTVRSEATAIFAGFSDKRYLADKDISADEQKTLIIKGFLLFSGLEVKSA